jgi:hypothetical protein
MKLRNLITLLLFTTAIAATSCASHYENKRIKGGVTAEVKLNYPGTPDRWVRYGICEGLRPGQTVTFYNNQPGYATFTVTGIPNGAKFVDESTLNTELKVGGPSTFEWIINSHRYRFFVY